jgi:hypothetical protein
MIIISDAVIVFINDYVNYFINELKLLSWEKY